MVEIHRTQLRPPITGASEGPATVPKPSVVQQWRRNPGRWGGRNLTSTEDHPGYRPEYLARKALRQVLEFGPVFVPNALLDHDRVRKKLHP